VQIIRTFWIDSQIELLEKYKESFDVSSSLDFSGVCIPINPNFFIVIDLPCVILDKYELYIQKQDIISIDGIHIKLPMPN
jgi:hypothetical protein